MWKKIEHFFLFPSSYKPLAFLRIGIATILLIQAWMCSSQFFELYGTQGILQQEVGERFARGEILQPTEIIRLAEPYGFSERTVLLTLAGSYIAGLFGLLVGFCTPLSAFLSWGLQLILAQGHFTGYGVDLYSHFALFYFIFMPVATVLSFDSYFKKKKTTESWTATLSLRVFQIHLAIAYLSTGTEKAMGEQWRNGEAIWRSLMLPMYRQFDMGWLSHVPWLALLFGWGTLLIEIGYPFFIFPKKTRKIWVLLTVSLHLGISIFLGLHLFGLLMSWFTLCCFGLEYRAPRAATSP